MEKKVIDRIYHILAKKIAPQYSMVTFTQIIVMHGKKKKKIDRIYLILVKKMAPQNSMVTFTQIIVMHEKKKKKKKIDRIYSIREKNWHHDTVW